MNTITESEVMHKITELKNSLDDFAADYCKLIHTVDNNILLKSVEDLNLTVRSSNALKCEEIFTIGDLIKLTKYELLKVSNLGKKCVCELRFKLKEKYGLDLKNAGAKIYG